MPTILYPLDAEEMSAYVTLLEFWYFSLPYLVAMQFH
jgi:hypothetical protein